MPCHQRSPRSCCSHIKRKARKGDGKEGDENEAEEAEGEGADTTHKEDAAEA